MWHLIPCLQVRPCRSKTSALVPSTRYWCHTFPSISTALPKAPSYMLDMLACNLRHRLTANRALIPSHPIPPHPYERLKKSPHMIQKKISPNKLTIRRCPSHRPRSGDTPTPPGQHALWRRKPPSSRRRCRSHCNRGRNQWQRSGEGFPRGSQDCRNEPDVAVSRRPVKLVAISNWLISRS